MSLGINMLKYDMAGHDRGLYEPFLVNAPLSQTAGKHYASWLAPVIPEQLQDDWAHTNHAVANYQTRENDEEKIDRPKRLAKARGILEAQYRHIAEHLFKTPNDKTLVAPLNEKLDAASKKLEAVIAKAEAQGTPIDSQMVQDACEERAASDQCRFHDGTVKELEKTVKRGIESAKILKSQRARIFDLGDFIDMHHTDLWHKAMHKKFATSEADYEMALATDEGFSKYLKEWLKDPEGGHDSLKIVASYGQIFNGFIATVMAQCLIDDHFAKGKPKPGKDAILADRKREQALEPVMADYAKQRAELKEALVEYGWMEGPAVVDVKLDAMEASIRATAKQLGLKRQEVQR